MVTLKSSQFETHPRINILTRPNPNLPLVSIDRKFISISFTENWSELQKRAGVLPDVERDRFPGNLGVFRREEGDTS